MRNIDRSEGPLILVYTARSLRNRWPHFYWSMTDEVRWGWRVGAQLAAQVALAAG